MPMLVAAVCAFTLAAGGCGEGDGAPLDVGHRTSGQTTLQLEGKIAYGTYCVGCHGVNGDGKGEAAVFLSPSPRDFQTANFKFSSTRAGRLPTDADLRRTIVEGLRGSSMPRWNLLPARTVDALVVYIKTFSPKWTQRRPASLTPKVDDPYRRDVDKTRAVQRGEAVYHGYATCWTCHAAYVTPKRLDEHLVAFGGDARGTFRENLGESLVKPNQEGELIYPPDFLRDFVRAGADVDILYRSIAGGISGTAMPTWVDSMEYPGAHEGDPPLVQTADLWALAYYVQNLIIQRPPTLALGEFDIRERPQRIFLNGAPPPSEAIKQTEQADTDEEFSDEDEEFSDEDEEFFEDEDE